MPERSSWLTREFDLTTVVFDGEDNSGTVVRSSEINHAGGRRRTTLVSELLVHRAVFKSWNKAGRLWEGAAREQNADVRVPFRQRGILLRLMPNQKSVQLGQVVAILHSASFHASNTPTRSPPRPTYVQVLRWHNRNRIKYFTWFDT